MSHYYFSGKKVLPKKVMHHAQLAEPGWISIHISFSTFFKIFEVYQIAPDLGVYKRGRGGNYSRV